MRCLAWFGYGMIAATVLWTVLALCNARAARREDREAGIRELVKQRRQSLSSDATQG